MQSLHINFTDISNYFTAFQYPAGEWQVRLTSLGIEACRAASDINVMARLSTAGDLVRLVLLLDAINGVSNAKPTLRLPYLPYGRADRRFVDGDCWGLQAFARILNTLPVSKIITLDVHNPVAASSMIENLVNASAMPFITKAINDFADKLGAENITVLYPDRGAADRYTLPDYIKAGWVTAYCEKKRNPVTGKFEGFTVPELPKQPVIMIDDICDGGGTFVGIANLLPPDIPKGLYVTHGIFSRGREPLYEAGIYHIYTTDSMGATSIPGAKVYKW